MVAFFCSHRDYLALPLLFLQIKILYQEPFEQSVAKFIVFSVMVFLTSS